MPPNDGRVCVPRTGRRDAAPPAKVDRAAEVWAALATVTDPELDQSIVDLGFLTEIAVEGDRVAVSFRLPTFWCSANFAFIMAEDVASALARLGWVGHADIRLADHFAAEKINAGIAAGSGFATAFAGEASGDLTALRETFRRKAFLGRMSALIEALREEGWSDTSILGLRIADLSNTKAARVPPIQGEPGLRRLAERYLELRASFGGSAMPGDSAFRTADGEAIRPADLPAYLRNIRMTRRSVEANGEMCRILLKARNEERSAVW